MQRARRWSWTLNNYTEEEKENLRSITLDQVRYIVFGEEVAPTTNCAHIQGYVEFASLKSMRQVKELLSERVHLEKSKGTGAQNKTYCTKGQNIWEVGEMSAQGSRNDIKKIQTMVEAGATDLEIAQEYFGIWTRIRSSITEYRRMISKKKIKTNYQLESFPIQWLQQVKKEDVKSLVIWGESGIGKTEFVKALFPEALMISHIDELKEFDERYEAIIFDDMCFKHLPRTAQIHITDWDNSRAIHIRYGIANIPSETQKIFTTNEFDGHIFERDPAIERRVKVVHLIKE